MFIPYCDRTQLQYPSSVDPGLLELTIAALLPAQPTLSCLLTHAPESPGRMQASTGRGSRFHLPPRMSSPPLARQAASGPPCPRVC